MKYTKLMFPMMLLVASGTVFAATDEGATDMSFDEIDANGDGIVTREEAEAAPGLGDNFDSLDANADGVLDESEVGVGGPEGEEPEATGEGSESDPAMDEESETEMDY